MLSIEEIKKETVWLVAGLVVLSLLLFVAFQKSSVVEVLRTTASLYWLFVLPGYALALCSKQGFMERLIIGVTVQTAVFGMASYYAGLLGWHVATHGFVLPALSIIAGVFLWQKTLRYQ